MRIATGIRMLVALAACGLLGGAATPARSEEPADVAPAPKAERWGDLVSIFSGPLHLPPDVVQRGSVVCVGGSAVVEGDVSRDVVAVGCDVVLRGDVGGAVTGVLSDMQLEGAAVSGELVNILGTLSLEGSSVGRELVSILGALDRDPGSHAGGEIVNVGLGGAWFRSVESLVFWLRLFGKLATFVLIVLIVLVVPERVELIGEEAPLRYVPAFFMGVLGYLGLLVVVGLLTVTIVGVVPAMLGFWIAKWMGIAAIFHAIGRRLARVAGFTPSTLGAVLLVFAVWVVLSLAPSPLGIAGLLAIAAMKLAFFFLIEVPAVGLVLLTRLGTRRTGGQRGPVPLVPMTAVPGSDAPRSR